jgi:hypothetical protein
MKDNHVIYRIDRKNGHVLFKLDKRGQGQEEYLSISDFVIDSKTQSIFIYDLNKRKIIKCNFEGKYLESSENDFIGSFDLIDDDNFLVSYSPFSNELFHAGIYDRSWNLLTQLLPKAAETDQKGGLHHFDILYKFDEKHYIKKSFNDTLFQVHKQQVEPYLIISEGNLKIPVRIAIDLSKKKERSRYIYGESGYMVSDYYFSNYYYQNSLYQEIWHLETASSSVYRNIVQRPENRLGIPFVIRKKMIFTWPKFVCRDCLFCIVPAEEMQEIIPDIKSDDNPVILEIRITNPD